MDRGTVSFRIPTLTLCLIACACSDPGVDAVHGALVVYVSTDVRRFLPVIRFLVVVSILFGIGMLVLDCMVGLPPAWIIGEGPCLIALGVLLLWLVNRARRSVAV